MGTGGETKTTIVALWAENGGGGKGACWTVQQTYLAAGAFLKRLVVTVSRYVNRDEDGYHVERLGSGMSTQDSVSNWLQGESDSLRSKAFYVGISSFFR